MIEFEFSGIKYVSITFCTHTNTKLSLTHSCELASWLAMSWLCGFKIASFFGQRDRVVRSRMFHPPEPSTYTRTADQKFRVTTSGATIDNTHYIFGDSGINCIAVAVFEPLLFKHGYTILYSHGNAVDIGSIHPHMKAMAVDLGVRVIAYDYPGYGLSTGQPLIDGVLADSRAVYDWVCAEYPRQKIILFGHSIGSAPAIRIAHDVTVAAAAAASGSNGSGGGEDADRVPIVAAAASSDDSAAACGGGGGENRVVGIVLYAPISSAFRCFDRRLEYEPTLSSDFYTNVDLIRKVAHPVLVIHGEHDAVIPFQQGQHIHDVCVCPYGKIYSQNGLGHNNLFSSVLQFMHFKRRMSEFMDMCTHFDQEMTQN